MLGTLALYLALRNVDVGEALGAIKALRWGPLGGAVGLVALSPFVRAWRWRTLFDEKAPGFRSLVLAVVTGQTLNFLLPFRSGEVARVLMIKGQKLAVAGTIAIERFLDLATFAALCVTLPFVWAVPHWLQQPLFSSVSFTLIYFVVLSAAWIIAPKFVPIRVPKLRSMIFLSACSLWLWASGILVNYLVLWALELRTPFIASVVLLVILQAGVAIPVTPGSVGVFQYLAVLGLSLFGVEKAPALAFGLVLHLVVFLPAALMAAGFWIGSLRYQSPEQT